MEQGDDPYKILGVSPSASSAEIKKAYRKLAIANHPDKQSSEKGREAAQHVFARISNAYELIGDEDRRREYDLQQKQDGGSGFDVNACYDTPTPGTTTTASSRGRNNPVHFHDPYEVFKRAFEEEFGFEYPGAKYDYVEDASPPRNAKRLTNGNNNRKEIEANKPQSPGNSKQNKGGGIKNMFRRGDKSNEKTGQQPEQPRTPKSKPNENRIVKHQGNQDRQLVERDPQNNRPISMETKTHTIQHKNGQKETITETTIRRPDGSTETMRQTDNPQPGSKWNRPQKNKKKLLTNGATKPALMNGTKQNQRLLTNGSSGKQQQQQKPRKLLTNGPSSTATSNTNTRQSRTGIFGRK